MRERLPKVTDALAPVDKFKIKQTLMEVLATSITQDSIAVDGLVHWYVADVLTAAKSRQDLYHLLPKPLHQYVPSYIVNPQEDEPPEAKELKLKHSTAMEHINIRLTEKLLED